MDMQVILILWVIGVIVIVLHCILSPKDEPWDFDHKDK